MDKQEIRKKILSLLRSETESNHILAITLMNSQLRLSTKSIVKLLMKPLIEGASVDFAKKEQAYYHMLKSEYTVILGSTVGGGCKSYYVRFPLKLGINIEIYRDFNYYKHKMNSHYGFRIYYPNGHFENWRQEFEELKPMFFDIGHMLTKKIQKHYLNG